MPQEKTKPPSVEQRIRMVAYDRLDKKITEAELTACLYRCGNVREKILAIGRSVKK